MPTFGPFELQADQRRLLRDGEVVPLGTRAFDLLLALVERRERLVSKNELIELVWPGLVVEENNLQVQISGLRKLLGQQAIATVPGRGYRFTAALDDAAAAAPSPPAGAAAALREAPLRTNLPLELPLLHGRSQELDELKQLLVHHRLVTIIGGGGIGKTSLARAAAHDLRSAHADGVWVVELAALAEVGSLAAAIAKAVGVALPTIGASQKWLVEALAEQRLLLLIDNCEHLLDGVALLLDGLLAEAPGVQVLATSQQPLGLPWEHSYRLGPLAVPAAMADAADPFSASDSVDPQSALRHGAVALFVARAQGVDARFVLTPANLGAVIDICRQLDGIALAIELAAARLPLLGIEGLRERLGERFRLLTSGSRLAPPRHQTLHAALDWSHELLSADEQKVFRRLGIFSGGCTLETAQHAIADAELDGWAVLEQLGALVEKSMVVAHGGERPRYLLLKTTRAYALEQLARHGETAMLARRQAQAVQALLEGLIGPRLSGAGGLSTDALDEQLLPEIDNLRAALAWSLGADGDEKQAVALADLGVLMFWFAGLAAEGIELVHRLMPRVADDPADPAAARFWYAVVMTGFNGRIDDAVYLPALARAEQGCRHHGWPLRLHTMLRARATGLIDRAEAAAAEAALADAQALEQPDWPGWMRYERLLELRKLRLQSGEWAEADRLLQEMTAALPVDGEEARSNELRLLGGEVCNLQQRWDDAVQILEPLVDDLRASRRGQSGNLGWAYGELILGLVEGGRLDAARLRLQQALPCWRVDAALHLWLHVVIRLLIALGRPADALLLVGAWARLATAPAGQRTFALRLHSDSLARIEQAVPDEALRERLRKQGAAIDDAKIAALCKQAAEMDCLKNSPLS